MILCVCHAISDREVDAAIDAGARSTAEVGAVCRAGTDCGSCQRSIAQRISQVPSFGPRGADCAQRSAAVGSAASP